MLDERNLTCGLRVNAWEFLIRMVNSQFSNRLIDYFTTYIEDYQDVIIGALVGEAVVVEKAFRFLVKVKLTDVKAFERIMVERISDELKLQFGKDEQMFRIFSEADDLFQ
ncbi:hypothetical protein DASC09_031590 [Saccharomycopsis crataegensis]|uniref:Uncharacterized protein n=1 Tax=Saccharomycopsis crataegensis TaxID=43959 RepID=A0AAV5QN17_9ASCO|nr:hypothetical protein DASC09_031590 [Saccharomycopsis crataegensis]